MNYKTLGNLTENGNIFKGSREKPFLAPRGVCVSGNKLFVSDTGQNRVFIWNSIPTTEFQEPDTIIGQSGAFGSERNSGGEVSGSSLLYPSGVWSDGKQLIVADAWNHRVLVWFNIPNQHGQEADIVIGQPNFNSNLPNVKGIGSDPNDQCLHWPYGVFSDGKSLWIADTGNRRVLFFNKIPTENFSKADKVIGKSSFTTRDYDNSEPIWPYSVKINTKGQMAISDTQFYRTLIWNNKEEAYNKQADIIIGQESFSNCGQNQFRLAPEKNTLSWTYDNCFYKEGILINDTGNSRILVFENIPKENNQSADHIIGREKATDSSEFKGNMHGTQSALYWPFSITCEEDKLFIADTGNHRLVICDLKS